MPQANESWLEHAKTGYCRAKVRQHLRIREQTNELQAHLKAKELLNAKVNGEGSQKIVIVADDNHGIAHETRLEKTPRAKKALTLS